MWEAIATKMYLPLKTFTHKAYGQRLTAIELRNMSGQNGYGAENLQHSGWRQQYGQ
jgi:hypothetical protein